MRQRLFRSAPCSILFPLLVLTLIFATARMSHAQGAPRTLTATVTGSFVTLRWQPPSTPGFTGYLVEAGTSPNTTAVAIPVGNVFYGVTAPNGQYYVRVRAMYGSTPGPPSNEVPVLVALPPPPAPTNFIATVTHFTVAFNWASGMNTAGITGWQLHAGSAPGLSDLAIVSFRSSTQLFTATAPAGTYYVRVYAINSVGPSLPSTELTVVTGPTICDLPLTPTGFSAFAGNGGVRLEWDPWSAKLPAGYLIAAGTAPGASNLGTFPVPRSAGFTTAAPAGTYYARLAAYNVCGATAFGNEIAFTVLPPSNASLVGTWSGTVSNYSQPFPWTPITSFQLTLYADPPAVPGFVPGVWSDNKGCVNSRIFGSSSGVFPGISMESLECNDGDFVFTFLIRSPTVMEGRCDAGPNCRFRMTRVR